MCAYYTFNCYFLGYLNDLWKYSTEWEWIGGTTELNDPGYYVSKYEPNEMSVPTGRSLAAYATSSDGNYLALFGGVKINPALEFPSGNSIVKMCSHFSPDPLSDLWLYEVSSNTWTWFEGNVSTELPNYTPPNWTPGGRFGASLWFLSGSTSKVYLFGGGYGNFCE